MPVFLRDKICECVVKNREEGESMREWCKRWMCMFHWMQTDYYLAKLQPTQLKFNFEVDVNA